MTMTMKLVDPVVTRRAGLLSHDMHLTVFYQNHDDDDDDASDDNYDDDEKHFVFRKLENHHTFFLVLASVYQRLRLPFTWRERNITAASSCNNLFPVSDQNGLMKKVAGNEKSGQING